MTQAGEAAGVKAARILVIDDDPQIGSLIAAVARESGYACTVTTRADEFMVNYADDYTLIVTDLMMPAMDGVEILRWLGERDCRAGIVLMSGVDKRVLESAEDFAHSIALYVVGRLQKPFRVRELRPLLAAAARSAGTQAVASARPQAVADDELRRAIDADELTVHYQPQLDLASERVVGVEALVRWQHPQRGLVYPDAFIARAETIGLIDALGWSVARRCLADTERFHGVCGKPFSVSLNVSVQSLQDLRFPDRLVALAESFGVAPSSMVLEITETGLFARLSDFLHVLTRLRMKSFQLSIDDFGTGYAMMQQLRHVPATELKIDRSFVNEVDRADSARVVVRKSIEIGHELGLRVVAEGVETERQLELLREHGCDHAQGYYFARPQPLEETLHWIAQRPPAGTQR